MQGIIMSFAQHYHVPGFKMLQPITATLIPPMAWVAFQTTAVCPFAIWDYLNLFAPLSALVTLTLVPCFLDTLIPTLSVG